jgi:ribonuclease BN (tRNA processing enzyme)
LSVGGRSVAFFPDNELPTPEEAARTAGQSGRVSNTSTQGQPELAEFVRGVDILIIDSQYNADEYGEHVGWGHGCLDRVVKMAIHAQVKHLYLFHHDPNHDDETIDQMATYARKLARAQGSSLQVEAAREGTEVKISPDQA